MKCPSCDRPYKKTKTAHGRWLYERACSCKQADELRHRFSEGPKTRKRAGCE